MIVQIISVIRNHRFLALAFAILLVVTVAFGVNTLRHARDHVALTSDRAVKAWMTTRYIAHTWRLPREVMQDDLRFVKTPDGPQPLRKIAEERGIPVEDLIAQVEAAIAAHRQRVLE